MARGLARRSARGESHFTGLRFGLRRRLRESLPDLRDIPFDRVDVGIGAARIRTGEETIHGLKIALEFCADKLLPEHRRALGEFRGALERATRGRQVDEIVRLLEFLE